MRRIPKKQIRRLPLTIKNTTAKRIALRAKLLRCSQSQMAFLLLLHHFAATSATPALQYREWQLLADSLCQLIQRLGGLWHKIQTIKNEMAAEGKVISGDKLLHRVEEARERARATLNLLAGVAAGSRPHPDLLPDIQSAQAALPGVLAAPSTPPSADATARDLAEYLVALKILKAPPAEAR